MARYSVAALLALSLTVLAIPTPLGPDGPGQDLAVRAASSAPPAAAASSAPTTGTCQVDTSLPGSQSVGQGGGVQFITGQCYSPYDCASGCCVGQADGVALCRSAYLTEEAGVSCDFTCTSIVSEYVAATSAPAAVAASSAPVTVSSVHNGNGYYVVAAASSAPVVAVSLPPAVVASVAPAAQISSAPVAVPVSFLPPAPISSIF